MDMSLLAETAIESVKDSGFLPSILPAINQNDVSLMFQTNSKNPMGSEFDSVRNSMQR